MPSNEQHRPPSPLRIVELTGLFGDRDVTIEVAPKPITLLFGQNGAGKSTALRVIAQMLGPAIAGLPQEPLASAKLTFDDKAVMTYSSGPPARWEEIRPDGTTHGDELPDLAAVDADPGFKHFIEQETPYLWRDGRLIGPSLAGRSIPESFLNSLRARYRKWLMTQPRMEGKDIAKTATDGRELKRDCFLISSDRLVSIDGRMSLEGRVGFPTAPIGIRPLRGRFAEHDADVVAEIASDLRDRIRDARQESSKQSWQLDGSFIKRAAAIPEDEDPLSPAQRETLIDQIRELQGRMVNCALAASSAEIPAFPGDSKEVKKFLDLYLRDLLDKAKTSLPVLPKLELFEEILNSHFTDKSTQLSLDSGLSIVRRSSKVPIPLDRLSSGERHLIVLFHHLIFMTKPGGLCLIDEPEISLHVDWQERFIDSVAKVAEVSPQQYLIATHSPSIVGKHYDLMRDVKGVMIA
jgi:predicted ATPase